MGIINPLKEYRGACLINMELHAFFANPKTKWLRNTDDNTEWSDSDYEAARSLIMDTIETCKGLMREYGVGYGMPTINELVAGMNNNDKKFEDSARLMCVAFEFMQFGIWQIVQRLGKHLHMELQII